MSISKAKILSIVSLAALIFLSAGRFNISASENGQTKNIADQPVIVDGGTVEYFTERNEVTATDNVTVDFKGTKLRTDRLSVNTITKDAVAEGNVRIEDKGAIMQGDRITYNFNTKKGIVSNSEFISEPYFGKTESIERVSDTEFIAYNGFATTCGFNNPHYRIGSKKVQVFPKDKIRTKNDTFYIRNTPLMHLPFYNHSLKDPLIHVQLSPGKSKDWGPYMLSAWRYNLADNLSGRIYLDYRDALGVAEGFGANYNTLGLGKGDFKFYYTQERPHHTLQGQPGEFQRYLVRSRHKWDIDEKTNFTSEYYRIGDSKRELLGDEYNVLKDYFPREYELDSQPLSYALLHRSFSASSFDAIVQKRTNRWYSQTEKLPEAKYSMPSIQLGSTPFYLESISQAANFNKKEAVPSDSSEDESVNRLDSFNKVSLPVKLAFIQFGPFAGIRETYYSSETDDSSISPRTIFYTGAEAATKFYRIFDVKSGFLGMDINGLRHIITPKASYTYNNDPTVPGSRLKQFDSIDAIAKNNSVDLELSNKLQTKRNDRSVDFLDFRVNTDYIFYNVEPLTQVENSGRFSDIYFDLEFLPYSWLRLDSDATYNPKQDYLSNANYDFNFRLAKERSIGIGQRYQRKGGKEITFNTEWRLNPKWKFSVYERYQFAETGDLTKGLNKQEYTVSRDLHCWLLEVAYPQEKDHGSTVWLIFRLKAFPETEINFTSSFNQSQSGSQAESY